MAGFFVLELDTTSPDISIYAPNYTTKETEMEITISADETLSDGFQNFYIIDQHGERHDYIFSYNGNEYIGNITLSDLDNGLVTFYAQVKDEVGNLSALATKTIRIIPSVSYLMLGIDDSITTPEIDFSNNTRDINIGSASINKNMETSSSKMKIDSSSVSRSIDAISKTRDNQIKTEVVTK